MSILAGDADCYDIDLTQQPVDNPPLTIMQRDEAIKRTLEWERAHPPPIDPGAFDYAAEDAAIRSGSQETNLRRGRHRQDAVYESH